MRRVAGYIQKLRCAACEGQFATFVFSGDTDIATMDLETATAVETGEVVIGERLPSEMLDYASGREKFAERMSRERGVKFRPVPLLRAEDINVSTSDFSAFRRAYQPPKLIYGCPRCAGEAQALGSESAAEYLSRGGVIAAPEGWLLEV